jgi:hypothetical protein
VPIYITVIIIRLEGVSKLAANTAGRITVI